VSAAPWHLRRIRKLIYIAAAVAIVGIAFASALSAPDATQAWVAARELYGLWAISLLLASMIPGPLNFVLPWFPLRAHLVLGRRALGVSSFVLAVCHVACYLGPTLFRDWRALYKPGILWVAGLSVGLAVFSGMTVLAVTSRRASIRSLGPRRWKALHRAVYFLLPGALLHATCLGPDFGINKGPDVTAEVDAGCLVTMLILALAWLTLFVLRKRRIRWVLNSVKGTGSRQH